ncbi:hypothetical protein NAEGRDRAFT_78887 [Naegleria gruberi]|uniref:DUF3730 domain-containing protein n=1 Tax=Naegleria gruberi TaxID=5762 RepID=D2V7F2_NAEGR|nr:uncharacterized protein NAEGRDRAFT_78887 [Naegleria gruberi]EFC47367.1 hypothetical protein NAEGRDRAFT_78887 [Naegleria gruberi]|eukprot:XP_002680111.1 hypothetical protein NAEGRDRAFT_78887 [Naegleria gruberi strain NEG-M]
MQSQSSNKQSLAIANALKDKLASGESIVQRQAINGLYVEIKNPNTPASMANDIVQLLITNIRNKKSNRTIATTCLDVIVKIFTELDIKAHQQIKDIPVQNVMDQLIKFSIQIHPALIPHLTRSILNIYLGKFNDGVVNHKQSKEPSKLCSLLTSSSAGSPLVMLVQNRNECLVEILNQVFTSLTRSDSHQFSKLFRFFSPLFAHFFTNRKLIHEEGQQDLPTNLSSNIVSSQDDLFAENDEDSTPINQMRGTLLRNDIMNATHLKMKLLNELKAIILYKIEKSYSLQASDSDSDKKLRANLIKQGYSIVLYLVHFLPSFEVDLNSDVVASCFAPLKIILDLVLQFEEIFATIEEEEAEFCEDYLSHIGNEFEQISLIRSMVYRYIMSIYKEITHYQIDIEMYFNYLFDICKNSLEHFVEFIPIICNSILSSETELESDSWLKVLKQLVFLLVENEESFEEFFDSLNSQHRESAFSKCSHLVVVCSNLLYSLTVLLHVVTSGLSSENKTLASVCIQKIEQYLADKFTNEQEMEEEEEVEEVTSQQDATFGKLFDILPIFQRYDLSLLSCHYRLVGKMLSSSGDRVNVRAEYCAQWSSSLPSLLSKDSKTIYSATGLCCSIGMVLILSRNQFTPSDSLRTVILSAIESITSDILSLKGGLLLQPLIFYELPKEENPSFKTSMMQLLPKLGTKNDINVTPIVKLLTNMTFNKDLLPTVLRLFTELWKQNEKFFTKLKGFLFSFSKYIQSDSNTQIVQVDNYDHLNNFDLETRLAISCSVYEICSRKIEKGAELLPLVTRILCQENNSQVLCYALKSMAILTRNRVVDFYTVWYKVIRQNIVNNSKQSADVLREMCLLFQCTVEPISYESLTDHQKKAKEEDEYNLFVDFESIYKNEVKEIMDILWIHTMDSDESVRCAAFETLGMYPLHTLLYAFKEEESDDEQEPQPVGSEVLDQREENIFAKQEIRRGWLLLLCEALIKRLQKETSLRVLTSATPIIQYILKAELRKPKNTSIVSKDKKASSQSIGLTSFDKFDSLADFAVKQFESKKNMQVTASAVLWQGNLAKVKTPIPETEAFKRLLNDLAMDIVVGSSPEDFFSQLILTQGFYSLARDYYNIAVETSREKESQTHFDTAFETTFSTIKTSIEQSSVPSTTGNYILAMAGLCLALPINAHHHVLKIIEIVKKKLSSSLEAQEDVKYACNMVLASASFELHIFSQLFDLSSLLIAQLHSMINENSTHDVSSASSAISLGVIARNLCLSKTDNYEKGLYLLRHIANNLFSLCFKTERQLFEITEDLSSHKTAFKNVSKANLNWKQKSNLLFGIVQVADTLVRVGEEEKAKLILQELKKEKSIIDDFTKDPKSVDSAILDLCVPSCMIIGQLVLSFYHDGSFGAEEVIEYLQMYEELFNKLQGKSLAVYLKLYMYTSIGYGTLLFGALCETIRKGEEETEHGKQFRRLYLEKFANLIQQYEDEYAESDLSQYQIGTLLFIACLLGADLYTPITKSKVDDSDVFGLNSSEKRPLSIATLRSIFFNKVLMPKNSVKKLAGRAIDIFKSSSTEPKLSIKVRKYASFFVGMFSSIYRTDDNILESSDRIPVKYLSESGLVIYLVQKLTKEDSTVDLLRENISLHNLLLTEKLPKITWSKVIQNVFRLSTSSNEDIAHEVQKNCIRMFCKDAQGTTSSSNSISAISSLCESHSFLSLSHTVQMEFAEIFPQLIAIFPPSRTCSLIDDWVKHTFTTRELDERILFTALRKISKCEVKSNMQNVKKYVEEEILEIIESQMASLLSENKESLINILNKNEGSSLDPFTVNISVQSGKRVLDMVELFSRVFIENRLESHKLLTQNTLSEDSNRMLLNLLLRCQYTKITNDISTLKIVRQVAVKGFTNQDSQQHVDNILSSILTWIISEILSKGDAISSSNKCKFIQDTIDMLSFVFNDLESVYFGSSTNKIPFALENLRRALLFLSSNSLILGATDIYAIHHSHDLFFSNNPIEIDSEYLNMNLLIHGLASSFKNRHFDYSTEHSLMSRLYSVLANFTVASNNNDKVKQNNSKYELSKKTLERLLFQFIVPLLIQIKVFREDQNVSLTQVSTILEHHALKICTKLQQH